MYCNGAVWNGTIPECKGDVYFELKIMMRTFKENILKIFSDTCFFIKSIDVYIIAMNISHVTMNSLSTCVIHVLLHHEIQ